MPAEGRSEGAAGKAALLSNRVDLPDDVEDGLSGSGTLEFERKYGIDYGEHFTLVPSVNAFDMPFLTREQFKTLVSNASEQLEVAELVAQSARIVTAFETDGAAEVAEFARKMLEAVQTIGTLQEE